MTTPTQQHPYVNVPETVSKEAQEFLRTLRDPGRMPAFPDARDLAGWKKVQAFAEAAGTATSAPRLKRYEHTVTEASPLHERHAAAAYADLEHHKDPYVSPVYGDY